MGAFCTKVPVGNGMVGYRLEQKMEGKREVKTATRQRLQVTSYRRCRLQGATARWKIEEGPFRYYTGGQAMEAVNRKTDNEYR